jgi:hypothetical protein
LEFFLDAIDRLHVPPTDHEVNLSVEASQFRMADERGGSRNPVGVKHSIPVGEAQVPAKDYI